MKTKITTLFLAACLLALNGCNPTPAPKPSNTCQQCVDFEAPLTIGTKYGTPAGNHPGDVIFTTNSIPVSVYDIKLSSGSTTFGNATIGMPPVPFGSNQTINLNNINLKFDFTGLGFLPKEVQFEYLDQGADQNLSVNGSPVYIGKLSAAPVSIGGVSITVYTAPLPNSSQTKGVVILRGIVKEFIIGGQEFSIDQVCAK